FAGPDRDGCVIGDDITHRHYHVVSALGSVAGNFKRRIRERAVRVRGEFCRRDGFAGFARRAGYELSDTFGISRESGTAYGESFAGSGLVRFHGHGRLVTATTDRYAGVVAGHVTHGHDDVVIARFRAFGYDDGGAVERAVGVG